MIEKVVKEYLKESHEKGYNLIERHSEEIATLFFRSPSGELDMDALIAIQDLLSRPWWTRAWIVQECAVLGVDLTLWCGTNWDAWDYFIIGVKYTVLGLRRAGIDHSGRHIWVPWGNITGLLLMKVMRKGIKL